MQSALAAVLFTVLPRWKRAERSEKKAAGKGGFVGNRQVLRLPGMKLSLLGFMLFCATEMTGGLWAASYFASVRGVSAANAAVIASAFYAAITVGRLLSGFATMKMSNTALIRAGQLITILGAVLAALPLATAFCVAGVAS